MARVQNFWSKKKLTHDQLIENYKKNENCSYKFFIQAHGLRDIREKQEFSYRRCVALPPKVITRIPAPMAAQSTSEVQCYVAILGR